MGPSRIQFHPHTTLSCSLSGRQAFSSSQPLTGGPSSEYTGGHSYTCRLCYMIHCVNLCIPQSPPCLLYPRTSLQHCVGWSKTAERFQGVSMEFSGHQSSCEVKETVVRKGRHTLNTLVFQCPFEN